MKKLVLLAAVLVLLVPMAVFADSVSFTNVNNTTSTTWSYAGGATPFSLSLTDNSTTHVGSYQVNSGPTTPISNLKLTLTTGNASGFTGTSTNTSTVSFGSAGSSWTISGSYGILCAGGCTIATGSISGASVTMASNGAFPTFSASFLVGSLSPSWLAFSAMNPAEGLNVIGNTSATLVGSFSWAAGGTNQVKGATTFLSQTPEPATLGMLSMGLLGLAGFRRYKK